MSIINEIINVADKNYKEFHKKLIPTVNEDTVLGVRAPLARAIAEKYAGTSEGENFLSKLPHRYYDENIIHAFMLGYLKCDYDTIKARLIDFLPFIDNWAVCDGLACSLKRFFKSPRRSYDFVLSCIDLSAFTMELSSISKTYITRFGLVSLLNYYISDEYIDDILKIATHIDSDEYYINMANAWLISFCLIKAYDKAITVIEKQMLPKWVHNKSIQKAIESYRISQDKKAYLRSLRIK